MRSTRTLVLLLALWPFRASAQPPDDPPQQIADRFLAAMQSGDWNGMAVLMHPAALHEMRELLGALFEAPDAAQIRQQLLGVTTLAEASALSDTAVFDAMMRVTIRRGAFAEALRSARVEILGRSIREVTRLM